MSEIDKFLEEYIEDYMYAAENADKYIRENGQELEKSFQYGEFLKNPLREDQIFFVWDAKLPGFQVPQKILEWMKKKYGKKYQYVYAGKYEGEELGKSVRHVKKGTDDFWQAAACSKYIVSSVNLPMPYVKRPDQVYLNTMACVWEEGLSDLDLMSLYSREFLKTDISLAPSKEAADSLWMGRARVGGLYQGRILVVENPKEQAPAIGESLLFGRDQGLFSLSLKQEKKRLLILTDREKAKGDKYMVQSLLEQMDTDKYLVTVLSFAPADKKRAKEMSGLPRAIAPIMARGRMVMTKEELRAYRIAEKHPDVTVKSFPVRKYLEAVMEREWQRILGSLSFDLCLVLGAYGYQQYYLSQTPRFGERTAADLGFMENMRKKRTQNWKMAMSRYDRIYSLPGGISLEEYGRENQGRVMRLLPLPLKKKEGPFLKAEVKGEEYLVMEWAEEEGRIKSSLVPLPDKGSILVNGDKIPDEKRKALLENMQGKKVWVAGAKARIYQAILKDAKILDDSMCTYLYLLPEAREFFGRFQSYLGRGDQEYDLTKEVCALFQIPSYQQGGTK